jgi:hypothetical protein
VSLPKADSINKSDKAAFLVESDKLQRWLADFAATNSNGDFQ